MKKIIEEITEVIQEGFIACGYSKEYGEVSLSNRPDLCQFQCNGALGAAKQYRKSPFVIAEEVVKKVEGHNLFEEIVSIAPGFINIKVADTKMIAYMDKMLTTDKLGCEEIGKGKNIVIDYGGPNVAKPLHVGHLRTAIIGECMKRTGRFLGYNILGDVHLGDWGLQIGLIIAELKKRSPELMYFDEEYVGDYPSEAPFVISELEEIYPVASKRSKQDIAFLEEAKQITYQFQSGHKGYVALWEHILEVSIEDLKKNYENLNVYFDLWKKESDAQPYIPEMIEMFKQKNLVRMSEGALVMDVKEESDTKEIPPCILVKSDGATLYSTTDIATILERMQLYNPDEIIYIVDKRQELHFEQVFRCVKKSNIVTDKTKLTFLGFGTMNGIDGKPFKTRDGGVMRLEALIEDVAGKVYKRVSSNEAIGEKEARETAKKVGIAALKYADLSNQIAKDYVFDIERFTSFEGNTGPYILYTVVRINSILEKFYKIYPTREINFVSPQNKSEQDLRLKLIQFNEVVEQSFKEYMPHKICQYIYELSNTLNKFYHENNILLQEDIRVQESWIKLIDMTRKVLITSLDLLGIECPDRM